MAHLTKIPAKNKQGYKWLCVMEGPADPVTGKRRQIARRADTKNEAQQRAQEAYNALVSGIDLKKAKKTSFRESGEAWLLDYSKGPVKNSTVRARSKALLVLYRFMDKQNVDTITTTQYQRVLFDLFDEGYADTYIRNIHITCSMVFDWCIQNNIRPDNPSKGAKMPRRKLTVADIEKDEILEKYLERHELQEFLIEAKERGLENDEEAFYLLAYTGMRPGELCALTWPDAKFIEKTLRITKTLYTPDGKKGEVEITPPKTKGSIRTIDMDDFIVNMLQRLKVRQAERHKRYKKNNDDFHEGNYIFTRPNGRPINQKVLLNRMDRLIKRTSIKKKATPHIFRHTHVSMLAEAGIDLPIIMQRVGHDDAKTTLRIYTHVTNRMKKNANEKMRILFSEMLNQE